MSRRSDELTVGIIGTGERVIAHARAASAAGAHVRAVAADDVASATASALCVGAEWVESSPSALIRRGDLDVVHVCDAFAAQVDVALASGIAVVTDGPADADGLAAFVRDAYRALHARDAASSSD